MESLGERALGPGATLHDTYRLVSPLGRGGMGTVWKAAHLRIPKHVAIKLLHPFAYEDEEALHRFRREAEIASRLGHPNIVSVLDFNVLEDGQAYIVMEHLEGLNLRQRLRAAPMALQEAIPILRQIASALGRAHEENIVHRDLKPENVYLVLRDDPNLPVEVKVLDFGISKIRGSATVVTQDTHFLGTPCYMAPEQATKGHAVDARTDQFALGVLAYEMLSGQAPFRGDSAIAVLHSVIHSAPSPIKTPEVPDYVRHAITRALQKRPEDRFGSVAAFVDTLASDTQNPASAQGASPEPASAKTKPHENASVHAAPSAASARGHPQSAAMPRAASASGSPANRVAYMVGGLLLTFGLGLGVYLGMPVLDAPLDEPIRPSAPPAPSPPFTEAPKPAASADKKPSAPNWGHTVAEPETPAPLAQKKPDQKIPQAQDYPKPSRNRPLHSAHPDLLKATRFLGRGQYRDALRLSRRVLRDQKSEAAFSTMAIAYCGLKDLGLAKAMLRNVRSRNRRKHIRAQCRELGVHL